MPNKRSTLERFLQFLEKAPLSQSFRCWEWQGARHGKGYGHFRLDGRIHKAHRVSWSLFRGRIPDDLQVLHNCDNPPCVNPSHLFLGTNDDNKNDRQSKQRHAHGERNSHARLTEGQVMLIRASDKDAISLARQFGVTKGTIHTIKGRRTWKHI